MQRLLPFLFAALLFMPLVATPALARTGSSAAQIHVVRQGDTLYDIARQNGLTVAELKRLNGLSSSRLKLGQKLALNRAAAPPAPTTARVVEKATRAKGSTSSKTGTATHTVKKGDTLFTIARRYQTTVDELKRLNSLNDSRLKVGQRLSLSAQADTTAVAASHKRKASGDLHVVKKGDSLHAIARRHGTTVAELKRLNNLSSTRLKIGQQLALSNPEYDSTPVQRPGDASEDEVLEMAYAAGSELEQAAFGFLSTPYRFGGNSRKGIDCSAFVQQVFREIDVDLPRSAREQYRVGEEVERDELQPGDLLFFHTYAKFPSHVGIYVGEGKMIHASSRSRRVVVTSIDYPYYRKRFIGAKRITLLDEAPGAGEQAGEAETAVPVEKVEPVIPAEPAVPAPTDSQEIRSTEATPVSAPPGTFTASVSH